MSSGPMDPARPLLVGGGLALLAASSEIFGVVRLADLTAPAGRFAMVSQALPHVVPLLGGATLMVVGCWSSRSSRVRWAAAGLCMLVAVGCLAVLPWILSDAATLAYSVRGSEVFRFRGQVIRAHLYVIAGTLLLLWAAWRLARGGTTEVAAR
ncbi:MAG TPA: hypothetical protein VF187_11625 [Gemmatimonadales bacterium]